MATPVPVSDPSPAPTPIQLPSSAILVLAVIASVLTGLLRADAFTIFGSGADSYVGVALAVLGAFVGPITAGDFRNMVHLSAKVVSVIGVIVLVAQTLLVQVHGAQLSAILMGVVTFASFLGFGPGVVSASARLAR